MPSVSESRSRIPFEMPFFVGGNTHDVQLQLLANPELLRIGTTESITLGGWFYLLPKTTTGSADNQNLFKLDFNYANNKGYLLQVDNTGRIVIFYGNTSVRGKPFRIPIGKLAHIAVAITGTTASLYVNCTLVDSLTVGRVADDGVAAQCQILSENTGTTAGVRRIFGYAKDVFGVKSVLTAPQIEEVANRNFSGLGFVFPLTEKTGTTYTDLSGNSIVASHNGAANVWATTVPPQRSKRDKQCAVFNGSTSYATLPADIVPSTTNFNLAMWFKVAPTALNSSRLFCWETSADHDGTHLAFDGTTRKIVLAVNSAASADAIFTEFCTVGKWMHVALTYTPNSAKIYVNSTLVATDTSVVMSAYAGLFTLGKNSFASTAFYSGKIADFVFHNAAPWTVQEVLANMIDGTVPSGAKFYTLDGTLNDITGGNAMSGVGVGYEYDYPQLRVK